MSSMTAQITINDATNGLNRSSAFSFTTTGSNIDLRRVEIGTSEVEHTIDSAIGNAGYCWIRNAGPTNYVEVGFATTVYVIRIAAGHVALFPIQTGQASLFLRANTATVDCEIYVHEA